MTARITVTGNAATAPLVRVTRTGRKVTNFRVASTERYQERETGDWVDGNTFFVSVACWGALADTVELTVRSGMGLVVVGKISQRTYTDADDKAQTAYEIQADTVAVDLSRATAVVTKVSRQTGPTVAVDEDGQPVVGVADSRFERTGQPTPRRDDDTVTVHRDGSYGLSDGGLLTPPDAFDNDPSDDKREAADLVGARG